MLKGICKYCGQEKELINSHIIPKGLCQIDKIGPMVGIDSVSRKFDHNPKHQNGQKEPLLCKDCDNLIKCFTHSATLLKQWPQKKKIPPQYQNAICGWAEQGIGQRVYAHKKDIKIMLEELSKIDYPINRELNALGKEFMDSYAARWKE